MTVTSEGRQFDRLATMWLGDIEIFRTSTAEPKPDPGISWNYMKDMTAYHSLWTEEQTVIFDLGNLLNEKYTGSFNVTISAHFYNLTLHGPHPDPADKIIPISAMKGKENKSSAFSFPQDHPAIKITTPRNVNTAILTIAATAQGEEEFWWSNVPQDVADHFNYSDNNVLPGFSSFREVRVRIDGEIAGLAWPFPVIFTGGISPPLHRPMVGLQAFDLREYEIDITPWLGVLCDGRDHTVSLEVAAVNGTGTLKQALFVDAPSSWVLSGKIFMWLDDDEDNVTTGTKPKVSLNGNDYRADIKTGPSSDLFYKQAISRSYSVQAEIWSLNDRRPVEWTQSFSMNNDGFMKDFGYWHDVEASYSGQGSSTTGTSPGLSTAFSYPLRTTYGYKSPDPDSNASLAIHAELMQEMELTVMGHTPFATGLEPFLGKMGTAHYVVGTHLKTFRQGSAQFYQYGDKYSTGFGHMSQDYTLRCADPISYGLPLSMQDPKKPWAVTLGPRLYERRVDIVNETKVRDEEVVWDAPIKPRGTPQHGLSEKAPEFALLPMKVFGGTKIFRGDDGVQISEPDNGASPTDSSTLETS